MKNILITGITGFVGSHMADYILKHTDHEIYASKRWRSPEDNIKHLLNNPRVHFIEADLLDQVSLTNLVYTAAPDYVFHFAAQSAPQASFKIPISTIMTNTIGTTNLLDILVNARDDGICDPIIISVSTSEVYGMPEKHEVPIKETNPIRAANPYSISKVGHDLMSQYYHKAHGLKIIITRLFSHEGMRRGKDFALSSFAYQIAQHEKAIIPPCVIKVGNLSSVRTYAHIDDAIIAYWLCATKGKVGEIYNIGGSETCTVGDALESLLEKSSIDRKDLKIVVDPALMRPTDITLQIPDWSKFHNITGWSPVKTLDDITTDMLTYWRGW